MGSAGRKFYYDDFASQTGIFSAVCVYADAGYGTCSGTGGRRTGFEVSIKWPNDVVISRKKICGILTEMSTEIDYINYVVIGIGINT